MQYIYRLESGNSPKHENHTTQLTSCPGPMLLEADRSLRLFGKLTKLGPSESQGLRLGTTTEMEDIFGSKAFFFHINNDLINNKAQCTFSLKLYT